MRGALPAFAEALEQMRRHLAAHGAPDHLCWVFREDVLSTGPVSLYVLGPPRDEAAHLAAKVYAEGTARGLVEVIAVGTHVSQALTTVWYPKFPAEEVQGWEQGLKRKRSTKGVLIPAA